MDLHPFLLLVYMFVKKKSISTFQFTLISHFFDMYNIFLTHQPFAYLVRNCLVRSSFGWSITSCGSPCSTITPPSIKITWSATSRAKAISCVTIIIVVFCCARERMTLSTSPVSSGSRADVGSSKQSISGLSASALAIATRCCCPPES